MPNITSYYYSLFRVFFGIYFFFYFFLTTNFKVYEAINFINLIFIATSIFFLLGLYQKLTSIILIIGHIFLAYRGHYDFNFPIILQVWVIFIYLIFSYIQTQKHLKLLWILSLIAFAFLLFLSGILKILTLSHFDHFSYFNSWAIAPYLFENFFPANLNKILNILCVIIQVLYLPSIFSKKSWPFIWIMYLIILFIYTVFGPSSIYTPFILFLHFFVFNPNWIKASKTHIKKEAKPIIFFDGICGICNGFINFMIDEDKNHYYHFATLQGETSKNKLKKELRINLSTIVLYEEGEIYTQSVAVFRIFSNLGGLWKLISYLRIFPTKITNIAYRIISLNRYFLFGKEKVCRVPNPEEKVYFLP